MKERVFADSRNLFIEGESAVKNDIKIKYRVRGMNNVAAKGYRRRDDFLKFLRIANL